MGVSKPQPSDTAFSPSSFVSSDPRMAPEDNRTVERTSSGVFGPFPDSPHATEPVLDGGLSNGDLRPTRGVVLLAITATVLVVGLLLAAIVVGMASEFESARERTQLLARVVELNVTKTFEAVEASLLTVEREFSNDGAVRTLSARVDAQQAAEDALQFSPYLRQIVATIAGRVVVDTAERSLGGRIDYAALQREGHTYVDPRSLGLQILPLAPGRFLPLEGVEATPTSRMLLPVLLERQDVTVVAAVNPAYFETLIAPTLRDLPADVSIIDLDGHVLYGPDVNLPNAVVRGESTESLLLRDGAFEAFHVSSRYPFTIVTRIERRAVAATWLTRNLALVLSLVVAALLLVTAIAVFTMRSMSRGRLLGQRLQSLFQASDRSSTALAVSDGAFQLVYANQAFMRLFEGLHGTTIDVLLDRLGVHDVEERSIRGALEELDYGAAWHDEFTFMQPDGGERYLRVDVSRTELGSLHDAWVFAFEDVSELEQQRLALEEANVRLRRLANEDPLTGLANRRSFFTHATSEVYRSQRYGHDLAMLVLDLDDFKRINDAFGHPVGDRVLQRFADVCLGALRRSDVLGRVGGEEFALLLPETSAEDAVATAEKLRTLVQRELAIVDEHDVRATVSIGVASWREGDEAFETLHTRADQALYRAKREGRNRVVRGE